MVQFILWLQPQVLGSPTRSLAALDARGIATGKEGLSMVVGNAKEILAYLEEKGKVRHLNTEEQPALNLEEAFWLRLPWQDHIQLPYGNFQNRFLEHLSIPPTPLPCVFFFFFQKVYTCSSVKPRSPLPDGVSHWWLRPARRRWVPVTRTCASGGGESFSSFSSCFLETGFI